MGKLKGFYKNNRVYVILMGIAIFCVALIGSIMIYYMLSQNSGDAYGNRLNGIETISISEVKLTEVKNSLNENEKVDKVSARVKGKIVYLTIYLKEGKASDAKNIAMKSLDSFSEDEKSFYDIAFIVEKTGDVEDVTFPIMGYKKSDNTIISWTNYSE